MWFIMTGRCLFYLRATGTAVSRELAVRFLAPDKFSGSQPSPSSEAPRDRSTYFSRNTKLCKQSSPERVSGCPGGLLARLCCLQNSCEKRGPTPSRHRKELCASPDPIAPFLASMHWHLSSSSAKWGRSKFLPHWRVY